MWSTRFLSVSHTRPSITDEFFARSLSMLPGPAAITPKHFQRRPLSESQTRLVELKLGRSSISNPAAVAGFLSCYFPNVKYIHGDWRPASVLEQDDGVFYSEEETREIIAEVECRAAWYKVVDNILPEIARIREHERRQLTR